MMLDNIVHVHRLCLGSKAVHEAEQVFCMYIYITSDRDGARWGPRL